MSHSGKCCLLRIFREFTSANLSYASNSIPEKFRIPVSLVIKNVKLKVNFHLFARQRVEPSVSSVKFYNILVKRMYSSLEYTMSPSLRLAMSILKNSSRETNDRTHNYMYRGKKCYCTNIIERSHLFLLPFKSTSLFPLVTKTYIISYHIMPNHFSRVLPKSLSRGQPSLKRRKVYRVIFLSSGIIRFSTRNYDRTIRIQHISRNIHISFS